MSDYQDLCDHFGQKVGDPEALDNILDIIHDQNEKEPLSHEDIKEYLTKKEPPCDRANS